MCRINVLYAKTVKLSLLLIISLNNIPLTFLYQSLYPHYIPIDIPFSTISPLSYHIVGKMNHARAKQLREELVLLLRFPLMATDWEDMGRYWGGMLWGCHIIWYILLMYIDLYWCVLMYNHWCILRYIDLYWCVLMYTIQVYWCILIIIDVYCIWV